MLNRTVYLFPEEETIELPVFLPFACTHKYYEQAAANRLDPHMLIHQISQMRTFLVKPAKMPECCFVLTDQAVLTCKLIDSNNYFLITGVRAKTVSAQNEFLRHAVKIITPAGAILWQGQQILSSSPPFAQGEAMAAFPRIAERLRQLIWHEEDNTEYADAAEAVQELDDWDDWDDTDYEGEEEAHLDKLLDIAEFYNIAEDELQQIAAQSGTQLFYIDRMSLSNHTRVEKLVYRFQCAELDMRSFKKNSKISLQLADGSGISGTITRIEADIVPIEVDIAFDEKFNDADLSRSGLIMPEYNPIQREVREAVIQHIRDDSSQAGYIREAIGHGRFRPYADKDVSGTVARLKAKAYPPNDSQIDAIVKGIQSEDALLVLGPPGTGKTTVILEWVKYFVKTERKRVLISSQNNKAVDNVLERLAEESGIEIIRVGNEDKVQTNVQHLMFEKRTFEFQQRITAAIEKHMDYIAADKQALELYRSLLVHAKNCLEKLRELRIQLDSRYSDISGRYAPPLQQLLEKHEMTVRELDQLTASLDRHLAGITRFEESGRWMRMIGYPAQLWRKRQVGLLEARYAKHQSEESAHAERYNRLYDEMLESLHEPTILSMKEQLHAASAHWETLNPPLAAGVALQSHLSDIAEPPLDGNNEHLQAAIEQSLHQSASRLVALNHIESAVLQWRHYLRTKKNYALAQVVLDSVDLVGATCIGINSQMRFQDIAFDVTIMDEAGQIQIHNALVPMSRSPKVIMLGDHMQIPPIEDSDVRRRCEENSVDASLLSTSFFEYLYERFDEDHKILLDTQYRMPEEIAELLSAWFYDGRYKSFEGKRHMSSVFPGLLDNPFTVITTSDSRGRQETDLQGEGSYNAYEAELAVGLLEIALKTVNPETLDPNSRKHVHGGRPFHPEEIGIITPYNAQVKTIRQLAAERIKSLHKDTIDEMVASLDSFQGQERPIIIYSCVRSNRKHPGQKRIGFLKELRRLNVALSRCQQQLVLLGDIDFFLACEHEDTPSRSVAETGAKGGSEKQFAEFMRRMKAHIERSGGSLMPSETLNRKMKEMMAHVHD